MKKDSPYNPKVVRAYFSEMGLPDPIFEHKFHATRKWRFDLAFLPEKVAVEVQGGLFTAGRHTRGAALLAEHEKLNAAACAGWRLLYCQPKDLCAADFVRALHLALDYELT